MSDETQDLANMLRSIHIVDTDGTERQMDEEESLDFAQLLEQISENIEQERPHMEAAIEELQNIPGLDIHTIEGNCPVQGEGTYQEKPFYFRARGTHALLCVGSTKEDNPERADRWYPELYAEVRVTEEGDEFGAGWLSPEELLVVFPYLISNLEEQTHQDNEDRVEEYSNAVQAMVDHMRKEQEKTDAGQE